jgi:hypothetical protein
MLFFLLLLQVRLQLTAIMELLMSGPTPHNPLCADIFTDLAAAAAGQLTRLTHQALHATVLSQQLP